MEELKNSCKLIKNQFPSPNIAGGGGRVEKPYNIVIDIQAPVIPTQSGGYNIPGLNIVRNQAHEPHDIGGIIA